MPDNCREEAQRERGPDWPTQVSKLDGRGRCIDEKTSGIQCGLVALTEAFKRPLQLAGGEVMGCMDRK